MTLINEKNDVRQDQPTKVSTGDPNELKICNLKWHGSLEHFNLRYPQ